MYPTVLGERDTLDLVLSGRSIARFGDGEIALAENRSIRPQRGDPVLAGRLRTILRGESVGTCLVGIPNLRANLPPAKRQFWAKYGRAAAYLTPDFQYVSSFITRPDNAPWLDTPAFWDQIESLWVGQDVVLVRGDDPHGTGAVSLVAADLAGARSVREVIAPGVNAWANYSEIMTAIGTPARALLCLGGTATVLAVDLNARGVHAIDIGHIGMFRRRHLAGEPMAKGQPVAC
jgi:hypothetical protein